LQKTHSYSSIFKKFQGTRKRLVTASESIEIQKFKNDGLRLIATDEDFTTFLQFVLNNEEQNQKINDNYINQTTKIDFTRQALIVSYEAIIKNIYNSDFGYVIEFQGEVRGYSDHFYPVIVTKNPKGNEVFKLNQKLGPYLDTKFYPDYLNRMVDLFQNLNENAKDKNSFDLKKEVSTMLSNSSQDNSRKSTTQSFKCDVKLGKIIIIADEEEELEEENCMKIKKDLLKNKRKASRKEKAAAKKPQSVNKKNKCK